MGCRCPLQCDHERPLALTSRAERRYPCANVPCDGVAFLHICSPLSRRAPARVLGNRGMYSWFPGNDSSVTPTTSGICCICCSPAARESIPVRTHRAAVAVSNIRVHAANCVGLTIGVRYGDRLLPHSWKMVNSAFECQANRQKSMSVHDRVALLTCGHSPSIPKEGVQWINTVSVH